MRVNMAAARGSKLETGGGNEEATEEGGEEEEENILYDLLISTEWPAEAEVQVGPSTCLVLAWPADVGLSESLGCTAAESHRHVGGGQGRWGGGRVAQK